MRILGTIMVASLFCMNAAYANDGEHQKCREEIKAVCGQFKGQREEFKKCIEDNKAQLSPECQKFPMHHKKLHKVCGEDFKKYCSGVGFGPEHMKCVNENLANFSQPCQDEINKMKAKHEKHEENVDKQ